LTGRQGQELVLGRAEGGIRWRRVKKRGWMVAT